MGRASEERNWNSLFFLFWNILYDGIESAVKEPKLEKVKDHIKGIGSLN